MFKVSLGAWFFGPLKHRARALYQLATNLQDRYESGSPLLSLEGEWNRGEWIMSMSNPTRPQSHLEIIDSPLAAAEPIQPPHCRTLGLIVGPVLAVVGFCLPGFLWLC